MLFRTEGETPLGYGQLVLGFCEKDADNKLTFYSLPQLLTDKKLNSSLSFRNDFQLTFKPFEDTEYIVPQISRFCEVSDDELLDLSEDYYFENLLNNKDNDILDEIVSIIDENMLAGFKDYKEDFILFLERALDCLNDIKDNNFYYLIDASVSKQYESYVSTYNAHTTGEPIDYTQLFQNINVSKEMQNYNDELSIRIPKVRYVDTSDARYSDYLVSFTQELFEQIDYIQPFKMPAIKIDASNYKDHQDLSKEQIIPGVLSSFSMKEIEGDIRNDKIKLLDNEKKFYDRLVDMINTWYKKYMAHTDKSTSIIEYEKEKCILHNGLKDIIDILILFALNINWRFREYVPLEHLSQFYVNLNPSDDDDDTGDDSRADEGELGIFSYAREADNARININALANDVDILGNIHNLVSDSKATIYAYAEVIVKLLRWGAVKPSRLHINFDESLNSTESSIYLNLANLQYEYDDIVPESISSYNDGHDATLIGVVYSSKEDLDVVTDQYELSLLKKFNLKPCTYAPKCILGVILSQSIDETQSWVIFVDLLTLVAYVESNKLDIEGISLRDGKIMIEDDDNFYSEVITYDTGETMDNVTTVDEAIALCNRNKRLNKRLYYNEKLVKDRPDYNLQQINSCNIFDVFSEMSVGNQVALYKTLGNKTVFEEHLALGIVLYKYFQKMEDKDNIRLEDAIQLLLEARDEDIVGEDTAVDESSSEYDNSKTDLFSSTSTVKEPVKVLYTFNYVSPKKNVLNAVITDNNDFIIDEDLGKFNTASAKSLKGDVALLKVVAYAYATETKQQDKIKFSESEIEKLKLFLDKEFSNRNLVSIYKALDKSLKQKK